MAEAPSSFAVGAALAGQRVAFLGKLAGMPKREAQQLVREHAGATCEPEDAGLTLLIVGEAEAPLASFEALLDERLRKAADESRLTVLTETQLWQRLGLVEAEQHVHRLYTPAMLADLLSVPVAVIRRWHRKGLIVPAREVRRLAYFDFQEVATARRLAELLAAGVSPQAIEKKLAAIHRLLPGVARPLAQLSVMVEGKELLLRQGDGLIDPGGQLRFDFGAEHEPAATLQSSPQPAAGREAPLAAALHETPSTPDALRRLAASLEDDEDLAAAADAYRAALAAGGPQAELCFALAELLYRQGDLTAARERYYMAVELDEDYVEARANLGCVLAELGERELAVAAFEGALRFHGDYPDAHFHLARALDELGRPSEAEVHWRTFLDLSSDNPWAVTARERLGQPL